MKRRIAIELEGDAAEELHGIAGRLGLDPRKVIALALGFFKMVVNEEQAGRQVYIELGGGQKRKISLTSKTTLEKTNKMAF